MEHKVSSVTKTEHEVIIKEGDITEWLKRRQEFAGIKRNEVMTITIQVPTGGDYFGDTLGLDEIGGLRVTWTETMEEP